MLFSCSTEPESCGPGFTESNGGCVNANDMSILQELADSNGFVDPHDLSIIKWNKNGRLTMLWLYDDSLISKIPENIGNLTYLDTLNLSFNYMKGEIPQSIGNLDNLDFLYLYSNQFSGIIPDSICAIFPNLSHFWIQYNHLCPPYPMCIPLYEINPQDTSQCPE